METLVARHEHAAEIKKSRFIARVAPAASIEEALAFVRELGDPDATHNCWAYRIGSEYRFNDDGEPGGSAGRPILAAIDGQGLDRVIAVVTRYFGGIKLGVGGLVRAYGGTAAECLRTAPRQTIVNMVAILLGAPFESLGAAHLFIDHEKLVKTGESYDDEGVTLEVMVEESAAEELLRSFVDATRGKGQGRLRDL